MFIAIKNLFGRNEFFFRILIIHNLKIVRARSMKMVRLEIKRGELQEGILL